MDRWGSNARNTVTNLEVPLERYERLQSPQFIDDMAPSRVINGINQGKYERAVMEIPETFGIKKTSVCRRFIGVSGKRLREFLERDLSGHDCVAIFMDCKTFAENQIVIALGVTAGRRFCSDSLRRAPKTTWRAVISSTASKTVG